MTAGGVEFVHVDASLIVAVKPAGLLAVPGRAEADCLFARVQALHADARVVHRLDMATSGLVLFARSAEMQRRLSRAFADRQVEKRYAALVHGQLPPSGQVDLPLASDWDARPKQRVDVAHGKPSSTRWRTLGFDVDAGIGQVELEPVTGRTHQLRVHLLALGHPILGDTLYAPEDTRMQATRLMLHAERLSFAHPSTGRHVEFASPAPFLPFDLLSMQLPTRPSAVT